MVKDVSAYLQLCVCLFCLWSVHTKSQELLVQMLNKISKHLVKDDSAFWRLFLSIFWVGGRVCVKASPSTALPLSKNMVEQIKFPYIINRSNLVPQSSPILKNIDMCMKNQFLIPLPYIFFQRTLFKYVENRNVNL